MGNRAKFFEMQLSDLEEVLILEKVTFNPPWHLEHYEYELTENPFSKLFVLRINQEIIGYYGIWITFEECQITTIMVKDAYKGQGYGHMLMKHLIHQAAENHCERLSLEVRVSNIRAQNLYKKYGFEVLTIRNSYYEDNHEDAYLMMKGM